MKLDKIYSIINNGRANKKRSVEFILRKKIKICTKEIIKLISIMAIASAIITAIFLYKYNAVYKVTISGEAIGYVKDIEAFEKRIEDEILTPKEDNVAFVTLDFKPEYESTFLNESENINEDEIIQMLSEEAKLTYTIYAVTLDGENKSYVNSLGEAEELVSQIKNEYEKDIELNIGITEVYTEQLDNIETVEIVTAKTNIDDGLRVKVEEAERKKAATVNGVYLAVTPTKGNITSRYGSYESIRSHAHSGIDIATRAGTPIYAAAAGTVKSASYSGGYGNLIVIDHGNGVTTYYAHCSAMYVSAGTYVEAGTHIGAVGSTGYSTGNHLHFEVRINGSTVNPQQYLYK